MKIAETGRLPLVDEVEVLLAELPLDGARVLELGCGKAEKTRLLARRAGEIIALEVDPVQLERNLLTADLPNVRFGRGGAEAIPAADGAFDIVLMFKSLHHVPVERMDAALGEIARVLRPGGLAWISEPVYAGELNEVVRLFHDEQAVREAAFAAVCRAVESGRFALQQQLFFETRSVFQSFEDFEQRMIQVTHSRHDLPPELYRRVREKFADYLGPSGTVFLSPQRVDVLSKPLA